MQRWFFLILILISNTAEAQYFNERVLEKSFEQMDFFDQPTFVNPYGIGGFGVAANGLIDDPLLNLKINPAYSASDSLARQYTYLNFRSSREITGRGTGYAYPCYADGLCYPDVYYPNYYMESRKTLEPAISAAKLVRPGKGASGLTYGMSYQLIYQDEAYYQIPQDIYRNSIGNDYSGAEMADYGDIPIVDRYSGEDGLHQEGHFFNLMAAMPLTDCLDLGARLGRVLFNRDGSFGSQNLWESSYYGNGESSWQSMQSREQDYDHWDLSGGFNIKVSDITTVGLMGGYLTSDCLQAQAKEDDSHYQYGTVGQDDDWSYYEMESATDQQWNRDGNSLYGGVNLTTELTPDQTFTFYYRHTSKKNDLRLDSSLADTSYSNYYHTYDHWHYGSDYTSSLIDNRTGSGRRTDKNHVMAAALRWKLDQRTRLNIGATITHNVQQTNSTESVYSYRMRESEWLDNGDETYRYRSTEERKDLIWEFRVSQTAFHLPVMLTYEASQKVELQFGIKRTMRRWQINDSTLAVFDYRIETDENGSESDNDFGERYTQPEEKRSEVTTTMIAGMTIRPADHLDIRLLVAPNFQDRWDGTELTDLQWWIDFRLF